MEKPWVANIFEGFHESEWLNEYHLNKPKFYLRYVDEILAAFHNKQDSLNFLGFLNNRDGNIKFTIDKQINHSMVFLDVFILGINNQTFTLQTYKKNQLYRISKKPVIQDFCCILRVLHHFHIRFV